MDQSRTLIVYGLVSDPAAVAVNATSALSRNHAVVSPGSTALRFSSFGWMTLPPAQMVGIETPELLFALCKEKLVARIAPFSRRVRLFVDRYIQHMSRSIEAHRATLAPDNEIFGPEDWIYSAWLPLPHAQILLPPAFSKDERCFAELDVAFWTGRQLIGVLLEQPNDMMKSRRTKLAFLEESHPRIHMLTIPKDRLSVSEETFPGDLFDKPFSLFWQGLSIPQGPNPSPVFAESF